MKGPQEGRDDAYTCMRLQAIQLDKIQLFCRHTFTSHTPMKQTLLCSSPTPSGEAQTQAGAHNPAAAPMTPPQPQNAHTSSVPMYAGKPGDGNRVIISRSKWLKQQ